MYDLLLLLCCIAAINAIIGIPIIYYLTKKAQREELNNFYRLLHSTNFDFNYDLIKKIEESDRKTQALFVNFRLYTYDKFSQQLEALSRETDQTKILQQIAELKKQYENEESTRNL